MEEKENEDWRENQRTISSTHLDNPNERHAGCLSNQMESIQPAAEEKSWPGRIAKNENRV